MRKTYKIIGYDGLNLNSNEAKVAKILSNYFHANVKILKPVNRFKVKTPDYVINGEFYELKTIFSRNISKVGKRVYKAESQAENIVIDIRKTTIHYRRASQIIKETIAEEIHIKHVYLITKEKDKKVLDFKK
jgi:hypothetical protein